MTNGESADAIPALYELTLPGMVDRATRTLLAARDDAAILDAVQIAGAILAVAETMTEVKTARDIGRLALHHAKLIRATNETHADCLRIIVRAETRMAQEVTAAQAAGEVASNEGRGGTAVSVRLADTKPPEEAPSAPATLPEIGIDRQRLAEWRKRAEKPEAVEEGIQAALDEGRAPTHADINRAVSGVSAQGARGTYGTGENEWYTPAKFIDAVRDVLGSIDLDPATSDHAQAAILADRFFTPEHDGLKQEWHGRIWLNPPYAQPLMGEFVNKLVCELTAQRVTAAIMVTHNYTDTGWFHEAFGMVDALCFTRGRIGFVNPHGTVAAPTQGQAFFYFGKEIEKFADRFSDIGFIVVPWKD